MQTGAKKVSTPSCKRKQCCTRIIRTAMWEEILDGLTPEGVDRDEYFDMFVKNSIPFGIPQVDQNIADAVLFLCSDLSSEMTGQTLNVDWWSRMH